ncbi:MAG: nucleotidyl transferase AbiEii/AbiGii toxin family protein [Chloroflexi bacterium]|nr:nucleotidyl transferase AbiEii/AbiGii toxin family protein [Chloroflexota bacterium]
MFQNLLKKIARNLTSSRIPYMIIGGQALLLYGEPRLTKDIDVTLGVGVDHLEKVKGAVARLGLKILVDSAENFVKKTMVLPAIDEKSGIRVDFILSFSPYERQAIERTNNVTFGNTIVKFASLEDVVIHKIIAGRGRDIEDIKSILLKNPHYDAQYVTRWLREFDQSLSEDFSEAFRRIVEEIL